jgi:hypothetical protein
MTNCYATGSVTAANNGYTQYIGGLVGWANGNVVIQKSFATGFVTYGNSIYTSTGGLVGRYEFNANSSDSFFDMETTGQPASMLFDHGKTTAEMKTVGTFLAAGWDFSPSGVWAINGTTNNGYPYLRFQGATPANIWNGATSTDWNESGNWNDIEVPTSDKTVIIPDVTNDPVIGTAAAVTNLTIESGAVLTIGETGRLTVNGTLTKIAEPEGLLLSAGSSLIESSGAHAYVTLSITPNEWHLISASTSNVTSGVFYGHYLQQHNESTDAYNDITDPGVELAPMKGFALWGDMDENKVTYGGPVNAGSYSFTTTYSGTGKGWNLVGNPYPSSINWDAASGWTKTNVNSAIYCHVDGSTWATWVPGTPGAGTNGGSKYIAPGQGFFVQASASGSLAINNSARLHNATTFFKNTEIVPNLIRLEVSGNGYKDEAVVRFVPEATAEFDGNYDAHKLFGDVAAAAQVFTTGQTQLSINSLPETSMVPVGVKIGTTGTYTIAATEINDMPYATLEDTKTGIFTELAKSSYTFNFTSGEDELRFKLHFSALSVDDEKEQQASIYSYRKIAYINLNPLNQADIYIYNAAGQLIYSRESASGLISLNMEAGGVYIVKVISNSDIQTKKIFINQ